MAANANGEYRAFKYYEGLCSSGDFPKEIAKVLALGVKSEEIRDAEGNLLEDSCLLVSKNWDIVYPQPDNANLDPEDMTIEEYKDKILNQVDKINDTVILKTTTTPKKLTDEETDELAVDLDTNKASLTMYLEIYKPAYIANPEEYPLDCERQGITPKLITKEMYENSLKTSLAAEEELYTADRCLRELQESTTEGRQIFNSNECDEYVLAINAVYGNTSFSLPTKDDEPVNISIDAEKLAKIKQGQSGLYSLILDTLNSNEGIEPKEYALLDSLTIQITKQDTKYLVGLLGIMKKVVYTMPATTDPNDYIEVKNTPSEQLTLEFYLDGIYIPVDKSKYHTDGRKIFFDEPVIFEESSDGVMVVRYTYDTAGDGSISERKTMLNNHYVLMRLFDNINEAGDGPMDNVYNSSGEIIQTNSHISPWSKLSWYQDFEEIMVDSIDPDVSIASIHDGTYFVPLETSGLNADTKIRYWINTNNDRFNVVVMGNPSLDYERDRHLISACYCGQIDSFDNSINDTAGNFALFTSSSTEPCNTVLTTEKIMHDMTSYTLSTAEITNKTYDSLAFKDFLKTCPWSKECDGSNEYYIQLTDKTYFNREKWPKYVIVKCDEYGNPIEPVTGLTSVFKQPEFTMNNGKADMVKITLQAGHEYGDQYKIYVSYAYYQEKNVITSGVARDVFGNVIDVDKVKDYGNNTSDGVTSIMMYHTRSKAYYQKHHMLFATTEEYMSKVMYGKSSYTGEYYADRIKVTHGNDGPRGILSDMLVIDSSNLHALDELVINKDHEKEKYEMEETYVYFPVTAPYSPLSDSPNARYGFAIKKAEKEPTYEDEDKLLSIAIGFIDQRADAWDPTSSSTINPVSITPNNCSVYWKVLEDTAWYGDESTPTNNVPLQIAVETIPAYQGNTEVQLTPDTKTTISQGDTAITEVDKFISYIKVAGFTASDDGEVICYGISDKPVTTLNEDALIKIVMNDGAEDNNETFTYGISDINYTGDLDVADITAGNDIKITNGTPDKYLMLYSVKKLDTVEGSTDEQYGITKFACLPLKNDKAPNDLLRYPCSINVITEGGQGIILSEANEEKNSIATTIMYDNDYNLRIAPEIQFTIEELTIIQNDTGAETVVTTAELETALTDITVNGKSYKQYTIENVQNDLMIRIKFSAVK